MTPDESALNLDPIFPAGQNEAVSARLLRAMADHSPAVMIVAAGPELRIVYANQAASQAARGTPGALTGRRVTDVFSFVDPSLARTSDHAAACAEARTVAAATGSATIWWDVSYATLAEAAWAGATPVSPTVLITAVDVTHHEIARLKAEAARDTLDALLAYVPDGISIASGPQVQVDRISARGMALVGRDAAELTGKSALRQTTEWEVYRPGSDVPLPPMDRPLARATRTGQVTMNEMLRVHRPDGTFLTVLCNSGPVLDAAGQVTGAVMAWHDVSELQHAQAALQDSEERLRAVLLHMPAAVFIVEAPDGRLTFQSALLDEVLGPTDPDIARAAAGLRGCAVHKDGRPYELLDYPSRRALFRGEVVRGEPMAFIRSDGRLIDLEMHAGPVRNKASEIIAAVAVALDVTDRRRAEARNAFLLHLQDSLRSLTDPREILTAAATQLGRHLGAARIGYGELQADGATLLITNGFVDGAPPIDGLLPMERLGPHLAAQLRQGHTVVYQDAQADERGARPLGLELGARAHVSVPLIREGRYTGSLYVTHMKPHNWTPDEIALIEEVASRIWDAAERVRVEAKLRESEERLRLALESGGLGFWEYDVSAGKTIRSARHDAIYGYGEPVSDWSYEQFTTHIPEADRARVEAGFRAALEQGTDWNVECRMIRADGSRGWISVRARPHHGPDGKISRLLGTIADISERKEAEVAAIETAAKFEMFAQTMPIMVWTALPDGVMEWYNARVPEYCGISETAMKPDGWGCVHPDDVAADTARWRHSLASGEAFASEHRIRRHDGVFRWHMIRAEPIRAPDGSITRWIGTSADIHDQKLAEQAMVDLNATLERQVIDRTAELMAAEATLRQSQKMEAVGQLTGGLAHDFNNLLAGISGSLELLQKRLDQGRFAELDLYVQTAQGAARRAAALTHRLLAFSRRQTLDPKPTDVNRLIAGIDELIRRTMGPAITVTVTPAASAAPGLWGVLVDPNQLENALLNLCINARDAMPDGGRLMIETGNETLDAETARMLELSPGDYVSLSVTDTGCGMTPDVIASAFDPFFTTKPIGAGTGLGLSMVYGFARQSGGQARISSEPGNGAKLCLYLPRWLGERDGVEEPAAAATAPPCGGETVLVVDDDATVRMLIQDVLVERGYRILEAADGNSGLEILRSIHRVDLLITDVGLPGGLNGRQLAEAALMLRPDLKVLFITGYAEHSVIGEGHLKPAMHIMIKPFSLDTLGRRITEIISTT